MSDTNTPLLTRRRLDSQEEDEEELDDQLLQQTDYGSAVYRYPPYLQPGHFTSLEKLFFFTSSILLIVLFVFVGLYARSSQKEDDPVITPIPTFPDKNDTKKASYCLNSSCIVTAAQILQNVDLELDPCDDFYAYTCSKWRETHLIPDTQPKIDIETITRTAIYHRLDQLLTRDFNDPKNAYYTSLPNPHRVLDQQLFTKLADLYASCMNQDVIEKLGVTPLYPLFRSIQSKVPLSGKNQDLHSALTYLSDRNIWTFFQLSVQPDILTNPSQPILVLQQGPVGLPHRSLYDDPDVLSVYMQVVTAILDVIFKQDHHGEFGWGSWSTVATARRIVEFEKKLAQYNSSSDHLERWSLERLSEQVPQVNWSAFIKRHLDPLPLPTHLLVASPHFLKELNDVLKDASPRTLQMYLTWRTIDHHLEALGDTVMMHKRLLDAKLMGIEPRVTLERRNTCVRLVDQSALGELMGRYFVMDHRERFEQAKRKVEDMAQTIVGVIKTRVSTIEWADEKTKQAMLEKLEDMQFQVGYSADVKSVVSLADTFGDITIRPDDFFGNRMRCQQYQIKQLWRQLERPIDKQRWDLNAQSTNIYYDKEQNKVVVPAGLLQLPYFDPTVPSYLLMGTMGSMIGHQIMHAFDRMGSKYNHQGLFGEWWSAKAKDHINRQQQCLVEQFDRFGLDGEATLDHNFADLGAVSLLSDLLVEGLEELVPGLDGWTKQQLMYIQYARLKCSKTTKESRAMIKNVAPDRYRVNGPLINSNHFASTFGCKVGSFMNPDSVINKCQVW